MGLFWKEKNPSYIRGNTVFNIKVSTILQLLQSYFTTIRLEVYIQQVNTCSQNRQSTKFQNHENINFVEKLYSFILYNQVYIVKHDVKSLHSGLIFRENTSRLTDGFDIDYLSIHGSIIFCI